MSYELIITEKPSAAKKIAEALADKSAAKDNQNGAPFYRLTHDGRQLVVACAVGHLFTVAEENKGKWTYPVFNTSWVASSDVQKSADFTKKYATTIKKLAKGADVFTVATDYDIEGEVIGYQIIKHLCKRDDANRMKFSTLTKKELNASYEQKTPSLNWGQVHAGVTRHELDWYYGINLSRALTLAARQAGQFKLLSAGRVQAPALKILVDKEKSIQAFVPEPYWVLSADIVVDKTKVLATYTEDKLFDKQKAAEIFAKVKDCKQAVVSDVSEKEFTQKQPTPFDLTTLQTESYRAFGMSPSQTLSVAQDLYTSGWISYPRTSSQKLPSSLNLKGIIEDLKRQEPYKALAQTLLDKGWTKPFEGKKTDDAHPAIHPTGLSPMGLNPQQLKLYSLIVHRFLACFADEAKRATATVSFLLENEPFVAKGTRTVYPGWHTFYGKFAQFDEEVLPEVAVNQQHPVAQVHNDQKETKPPKRYTQASIVRELEKRGLGTKATRSAIIDNLYDRGYIVEKNLQATTLGIHTSELLEKYLPTIVDEQLTRDFEEQLDHIRAKEKTPEQILDKAKDMLTVTLRDFKSKEGEIGSALIDATRTAQTQAATTVACPVCKKEKREDGMMMLKRGPYGQFLGCSNHPDCTFTFNVPNTARVKASGKVDEATGQELLEVQSGRNRVLVNIDPASKKDEPTDIPGIDSMCPTCKEGKMMLRRSVYGQFLGCNRYPKCKTIIQLNKKDDGSFELGQVVVSKTTKKTTKKAAKKATKKVAKKTTKKVAKKTVKKATKKAVKKTA